MKIITMATESYINWLYHFLSSVKGDVVVYRINFSDKTKRIIEQEFPNVIFRDYETDLKLHEKWNPLGKVFKVTYLKGLFCKHAFEEFQEKILWSDCTELILGDLNDFEDKFGPNGFRINRGGTRDNKKTFAALFGLYGKRETQKFYELCTENKDEWFSDQVALGKLDLKEISQGDWISFDYDENAKSWSDRGETGGGKITVSDYGFTEDKYIDKINGINIINNIHNINIISYRERFEKFMQKLKVPTILVHTDDPNWCYVNSTRKVAEMLKDDFDFKFIYVADKQREEILNSNPDLVWARCSSLRNKKILTSRPDLARKSFTSITTGGELLDNRVGRNINNLTEAGLIVQNKEAAVLSKYYLDKRDVKKPIFLLPNGCDTDLFKPVEKDKFIVGWNGRAASAEERKIKGYDFYKKSIEILKYKTLELNGKSKIPFEDLPKFYDQISIMVLPSNCEGCSNTINEALASGVPVLAFKCGWHGEVCEEFDDGILWIERNIMDITAKLKYLKENPYYLKKMAQNGRLFAEKHSWRNMADNYKETFNKMIDYIKTLPEETIKPFVVKPKIPREYVKVRALQKVNLGKLEKNGAVIWFEKGMERTVPYHDVCKQVIDINVKQRFLEIVNN